MFISRQIYGVKGFFHSKTMVKDDIKNLKYVIVGGGDRELMDSLSQTHHKRNITYRGWWKPNYSKMTPVKWLGYFLGHHPFGAPSHMYVNLFTKKD